MNYFDGHNAFNESTSKEAMFSALNRHDMRQIGFNISGGGYIGLSALYYNDNLVDRNFFFKEIKKTGLVNPDEEIESIKDGRYFTKCLEELTTDEFNSLLDLLPKIK